jgi:hypothetical protein
VNHIRLPAKLLSADTARLYCCGDAASVREKAGRLILTFLSEEEGSGDWVQAEGILSALLPLRASWLGVISGAYIWDGC